MTNEGSRVDLGSSVSFAKALAPGTLSISGKQKAVALQITTWENKPGADVVIEHNGLSKEYNLFPGDDFIFSHDIKIEGTMNMEVNHAFPIKLTYRGETYLLNKTKNDKLILTK